MYIGPNYIGKGCRFFDPQTKRVIVSRSATYFEIPMLLDGPATPMPNTAAPAALPPPPETGESNVPRIAGGAPQLAQSGLLPLPGGAQPVQNDLPDANRGEIGQREATAPIDGETVASSGIVEISTPLQMKLPTVSVVIPPLPQGVRYINPISQTTSTVVGNPAMSAHTPTPRIELSEDNGPIGTSSGPRRSAWLAEKAAERAYTALPDPKTVEEALNSSESIQWKKAMDAEHDALIKNKTWILTPLPKDRRAVRTKWVLRRKIKSDGSIDKHKARLVAKGYTQRKGLDFEETFAPVARMTSIRILLALAAHFHYRVYQSDVNSAYLNSFIDAVIFMQQAAGYEDKDHPDWVCKLNKGIYGLKQAGWLWYAMYSDFLLEIGFIKLKGDPCIYLRRTDEGLVIVGVYVDDTIKAGDDRAIERFNRELNNRFSVKELGLAEYIVGIQLTQSETGISLCQSTYIKGIAESLGLTQTRPVYVPISETDIGELRTAHDERT
jgi:hypothetical protein